MAVLYSFYSVHIPLLLLLFVLAAASTYTHAIGLKLFVPNIITSTTPSSSFQFHAYAFEGGTQNYFINASLLNLINGPNPYACRPLNTTLAANAVVLSLLGECSFESKIRQCQSANCLAVIVNDRYATAGLGCFSVYDGSERDGDLRVPLTQISKPDNEFIQTLLSEQGTNRIPCVLKSETSPWGAMFRSALFNILIYGLLVPLHLWAIKIATVKIVRFIRHGAWKTQVFAALWLELLANLERSMYLCADPFFARRVWPSNVYGRILLTISFGPSITTSLIVALLWLQSFRKATRNEQLSGYCMPLPICVFLPLYLLVDLMSSISWGNNHGGVQSNMVVNRSPQLEASELQ